jgi:DNA-binding MarR family transcriptional regulator
MKKNEKASSGDPLIPDVVELLRELLHALLMASVPAWLELQLTLPQLRTLFIIAHNKSSSVVQISKHLGVGEPTASHLVDRLVQAGLVDRSEDPMDRRRAIVRLSSAGQDLIEELLGWEKFLGGWLHNVPEKDLLLFQRGLTAIMNEIPRQATSDKYITANENWEVSEQ